MIARILAVIAVAGAALACAPAASADIQTLATSGLWSAYGGTGDDNRALCGIGTEGSETRRINIDQYAGDTGLGLRLKKDSWAIPANTQVEIQIQIDGGPSVPMQATGNEHQLDVNMTFEQSVPFMRGIRAGRQVRIVFPSGNEQPWLGGLNGSGRAIDAFNACRGRLARPAVTQPFNAPPAPAQPAAPPPAPAQPAAPPPAPAQPAAPPPAPAQPAAPPPAPDQPAAPPPTPPTHP